MKVADGLGWKVVASADVSAKYVHPDHGSDYPIDVHSWYLVYWPSQDLPPMYEDAVKF